jgi:hypothetical protein
MVRRPLQLLHVALISASPHVSALGPWGTFDQLQGSPSNVRCPIVIPVSFLVAVPALERSAIQLTDGPTLAAGQTRELEERPKSSCKLSLGRGGLFFLLLDA